MLLSSLKEKETKEKGNRFPGSRNGSRHSGLSDVLTKVILKCIEVLNVN